jgi:hypothetical protein
MSLFKKIGGKGRTGSAWKQWGSRGKREEVEAGGRNGPNNVCTYE